jgi:hypothetical protein
MELKLIRVGNDWQVCFETTAWMEGRWHRAWARAVDASYVCEVSREDQKVDARRLSAAEIRALDPKSLIQNF